VIELALEHRGVPVEIPALLLNDLVIVLNADAVQIGDQCVMSMAQGSIKSSSSE
jgi:hypothetical protein